MFNKIRGVFCVVILLMGITIYGLCKKANHLKKERDSYKQNTYSLLSDIKRIQIDSTTMAADVKVLKLTLEEYKQYRATDLEKIKKMGARINSLQAAAKHELEVEADIKTEIRDTMVIRDTVTVFAKKIEMNTPYLQINGIMEQHELTGKIFLPVNLHQAVWIEPKHSFLWWKWGVKAVHQTIASDNPHVQIKYSEYIQINK